MHDWLGPNAPHLREDLEPDGAMEMAAYAILITIGGAVALVMWLCL